ncbi:uncharacterized protein LOC126774316 isoform X2 [Nymphalis io]|uniref:uncharacterized protein LOC126774316 isoform X2 n=1 Tax=Inachis io TaxID=171585 RepID=UPI002168826D|nr:uncharacterized protein LOC126774316 isoform X2 [Nymphalis io]
MSCCLITTFIFIILLVFFLRKKTPDAIFGIYSVPGKWYYLKYVVFSCLYYFRKYSKKNNGAGLEGHAGQGVRALANPSEMDRAQPLSEHAKLPGKGLLCSKKLPDTVLFGAEIGEFGAEGIMMTPVEPMKKWAVSYRGPMWYQNDPSKVVDVEFNGEWNATSNYFDYDCDLHPPAVIRSIAREKWSRKYFESLKTAHQSHYEQFGEMKCKFKIDKDTFEYTLPSFRDHSFGQRRDWTLMHRYAFHHIFLEDGTNISVGVICQPSTATSMEAGVVGLPNGDLLPVKWVDLKLYQHGEGGTAPRDYAFRIQAGDEVYTIQVLVEYEAIHYVSQEWDARMVERFCKFIVNGVPGRGVSEFHYRHKDGRPESAAKTDPDWFRKMCHKI